jgi:transposase-like protein
VEPNELVILTIYTASTVAAAEEALAFLEEKWGKTYPAIPKLWRSAWEQFTPFLDYDVEIRKVLCARVGRLVSGTRAEEDPLRHVPPKGLPNM